MTAALKISDELRASVERMRSRRDLDEKVAAYERGELVTASAIGRTNRACRRQWGSFGLPRYIRSPDRQKSYERRHRLAFSGVMPGYMAAKFTVGEMACFRILVDEVKIRGFCDLSLDEIAARAGTCRKTAQRAMHNAKREDLVSILERPRPGLKHFPNVVRIISKEWLSWINHAVRPRLQTGHLGPTTVTSGLSLKKRQLQTSITQDSLWESENAPPTGNPAVLKL